MKWNRSYLAFIFFSWSHLIKKIKFYENGHIITGLDLNLLPFLDSCHNYYKEYFIIYKRQHSVSLCLSHTLALLCKYGISNTCSWCFCNFKLSLSLSLSLSLFSLRFFLLESLSLYLYIYIYHYYIYILGVWEWMIRYMMMMLQVYSCNFWLYAS